MNKFQQAAALFAMEKKGGVYSGLLFPNAGCKIHHYGYPALEVTCQIVSRDSQFLFCASIASIDDSGLSFHYPRTTLKKAEKQQKAFLEWIEELQFACPLPEVVLLFCEQNGCYPDYW